MTSRPLELIHMDLFGPTKTKSLNENRYVFVLVDDFSRFTRIFFMGQGRKHRMLYIELNLLVKKYFQNFL